ncbi:MAG: hypothetical protein IKP28_00270 [Clostridia bacterium]|nr:hypothetical protein [Clostridia bacterium]
MKKIGFIGAFDKTDMLIQLAKILTEAGKKTIVVDSTTTQKAKYVVPVINPTRTYLTEFEGFDVAVGFQDFEGMKYYIGIENDDELDYDIALIDVDDSEMFENFGLKEAYINYFVTSFDLFSLKRGLEVVSGFTSQMYLRKILFSREMSKEEDDYLNFISRNYPIEWEENKIYFPLEMGDQSAIIEGQRTSKVKFKNLSSQYKDGLLDVSAEILEDKSTGDIKRIIRSIEKGV